MDLDKFKHINDTLGHEIGDKVLEISGGKRFRGMHKYNILARAGGGTPLCF